MGYIMYKGQSIDCSYFLGKDSSFAHFGIPKEDAPVSSLVPDELIQDGNIRLPILWFNEKYKQKYYISCTKVNDDDIPIGILLPRYGTVYNSWNKIESFLFDEKLTFVSINYLDANNIKGSNSPIANIPYGNINHEWEWDYLRGFQPGTNPTEYQVPDPSKYDMSQHVLDTLYEAIDNTEKLWNYYDEINSEWKIDKEFNTYAKSCYLYSTPGTKQGDWKMMDMNYSNYLASMFDYQSYVHKTREYLGIDIGGISGLTAFVYLNFNSHDDPYAPTVIGAILGGANDSERFAGFNDAHVCEAELTLSISNFKFKQGSASGRLNWLGIGTFSLKVEGYSRFNMEVVQYTKVLWNNDYPGCGKITGELIDADSGQKLYDFGVLGPNINFWRREGNYRIYRGSRKLVFDLDVNKKYIIKLTGIQTLDSHYMAHSGENYIITDAGYWVSK